MAIYTIKHYEFTLIENNDYLIIRCLDTEKFKLYINTFDDKKTHDEFSLTIKNFNYLCTKCLENASNNNDIIKYCEDLDYVNIIINYKFVFKFNFNIKLYYIYQKQLQLT